MLPTRAQSPTRPISQRRKLTLPDGKRLAVWVNPSTSRNGDPRQPMPRTVLTPPRRRRVRRRTSPTGPGTKNTANRVGFWRMLEVFDDLSVPPAALAINGSAIATLRADRPRGRWTGTGNSSATASRRRNMQKVENEADDIARTTQAIAAFTGAPPARLARARGLTETW